MSQLPDPFNERRVNRLGLRFSLLGRTFDFETNSRQLLRLVNRAYAGLPPHRSSGRAQHFQIRLWLTPRNIPVATDEPPIMNFFSAPGLLYGGMDAENFALIAPREGTALVVISKDLLQFPYHARYELIEFCVFTLASRAQHLVPLHAGCVGWRGKGVLLIGPSGAGKSTLALHCLLQGLNFLTEDAAFVAAEGMRATGISNFLHLRVDSPHWVDAPAIRSAIRNSPVIKRRSGAEKFEVDVRRLTVNGARARAAPKPLEIIALVFLSTQSAAGAISLLPLPAQEAMKRLTASQPYAANLSSWAAFKKNARRIPAFELRRGRHPAESAQALRALFGGGPPSKR